MSAPSPLTRFRTCQPVPRTVGTDLEETHALQHQCKQKDRRAAVSWFALWMFGLSDRDNLPGRAAFPAARQVANKAEAAGKQWQRRGERRGSG
jgi:hypothetical protein